MSASPSIEQQPKEPGLTRAKFLAALSLQGSVMAQLPAQVKAKIESAKVPVKYEEACRALAECQTIDEAKFWDDKSEALAAWAKIYRSDEAAVQARRLKLHAYRRMGQIAEEIRPRVAGSVAGGRRGGLPGPSSVLIEQGFTASQAGTIRRVALLPENEFQAAIDSPKPPAPTWLRGSGPLTMFYRKASMGAMITYCKSNSAKDVAVEIRNGVSPQFIERVRFLSEWLDELEQHLTRS